MFSFDPTMYVLKSAYVSWKTFQVALHAFVPPFGDDLSVTNGNNSSKEAWIFLYGADLARAFPVEDLLTDESSEEYLSPLRSSSCGDFEGVTE